MLPFSLWCTDHRQSAETSYFFNESLIKQSKPTVGRPYSTFFFFFGISTESGPYIEKIKKFFVVVFLLARVM